MWRDLARGLARRIVLIGVLAGTWAWSWLVYNASVARTGYENIPDEVLLAGTAMCIYAGGISWVVAAGHRRPRSGAMAGIVMLASYVAGSILITFTNASTMSHEPTGETPFSLLLELWFWIGVPLVGSALLGALGWSMVSALARWRSSQGRPGSIHRP